MTKCPPGSKSAAGGEPLFTKPGMGACTPHLSVCHHHAARWMGCALPQPRAPPWFLQTLNVSLLVLPSQTQDSNYTKSFFSPLYLPFSWGRPSIPFFQRVLLSLPNTCPVQFKCRSFSGAFLYLLCMSPHSECGFSPAGRSDRRIHHEKYEERMCVLSIYCLLETKDTSQPLVGAK